MKGWLAAITSGVEAESKAQHIRIWRYYTNTPPGNRLDGDHAVPRRFAFGIRHMSDQVRLRLGTSSETEARVAACRRCMKTSRRYVRSLLGISGNRWTWAIEHEPSVACQFVSSLSGVRLPRNTDGGTPLLYGYHKNASTCKLSEADEPRLLSCRMCVRTGRTLPGRRFEAKPADVTVRVAPGVWMVRK